MVVIDLKMKSSGSHTSAPQRKEMAYNELWQNHFCTTYGVSPITYRESLRDIQAWLRASKQILYHMGIRGKVSRNTLAHANQVRNWRIYA